MKKNLCLLFATAGFLAASVAAPAQPGQPSSSAADRAMTKVFGTSLNFSATMEMQINQSGRGEISTRAKVYMAQGNSRTELDITQMKGTAMPPEAAAQMKAMGMDQVINLSRHDTKTDYAIYPGLEAYAKIPSPDAQSATNEIQVVTTKLGEETLDGHSCVKNQYTFPGAQSGDQVTVLAWLATDLKNCPLKIQVNATDDVKGKSVPTTTTLHFVDLNPAQPADSLFNPPAGYRAYSDVRTMMQTEMMKKMGGGALGQPAAR